MKALLKLAALFALYACNGWLYGQSIYVYPSTVTAPRGSYQTVTAIVNGVNDKTVTWTAPDGGAIVGTNPCVVNEPCTAALYTTTAGTYHLTATSNANGAVAGTSTITITGSPTPATTHPRLYIRASDLTALQAKFAAGSPQATALKNQAISWFNTDNALFGWGTGGACGGTHTPSGSGDGFMQRHVFYYALMALVDPSDPTYNWNCYGHDGWVWFMNQFNSGAQAPGEDEWRGDDVYYAVDTDWLIGSGAITSPADLTVARNYVYNALRYTVTGTFGAVAWLPPNGNTNDTSTYNSLAALGGAVSRVRTMGNNYALARNTLLAGLSLTFDDNNTDDPPPSNTCSASRSTVCPDWTAGSRHAFFNYFTSVYLYGDYVHLEDPNVSWQALNAKYANLPTQPMCANWQGDAEIGPGQVPCFGDGRGGESSEGSGYGAELHSLRDALNMVWTAGYTDPLTYGPQMSLATSSWWDLHGVADLEFLSGMAPKNGNLAGTSPAFAFINSGDTNQYYRFPGWFGTSAATLTFDTYTGRTDRNALLEWPILNTAFGGPDGTAMGCSDNCGLVAELSNDVAGGVAFNLFLALPSGNPVTSPPADPRPSLPTDLYNGSYNQHLILRNGWTGGNANSYVDFGCAIALIDHEHPTCGRFQVYSGNEYITKGRTEFDDYNALMSSATQANMPSITNTGGSCGTPACVYYWSYASGGDWWHGLQQDFSPLLHSELPTYAAAQINTKGGFNEYVGYLDILGSSRDFLYLRGSNHILTYDRATTTTSNPKSVQINTPGAPTITGNQAVWLTRSGAQKAAYTTLLPASGTLTNVKLPQYIFQTGTFALLQNGTSMQQTCTLHYADGSTADVSASAAWTSDTPSVATVNGTGLVTGVALGSANIRCYWNGAVVAATNPMNSGGNVTVISGASSGTFSGDLDNFQPNDWEPYTSLKVSPPSNTTSAQFLNDLEWGASGFTPGTPTLVQSTAGQGYDCAFTAGETVMGCFMRSLATFTGVTYPASGATTHYVADLTPNTTYSISATGAPASATTDNAGTLTFAATGTGNVVISPGGTPTAATPTFLPVAGTYTGTQSVVLSSTTAGATLCYTTDGSTPTANGAGTCTHGSTYSTAVSVASSLTLKAIASESGFLDSSVGSAAYTITTPASLPSMTGGMTITGGFTIQ